MKLLDDMQVPDTDWQEAKPVEKAPVPDGQVEINIRASLNYDYPILSTQGKKEGSALFIAGGPTLRQFLPEIRDRAAQGTYIFTSNNTHDYLVANGIVPNACLLLDPKEQVKD